MDNEGNFDPNQHNGDPNQPGAGGEGQDEGGDVDQFFDDAGETFLPADHPLMSRLQNALTKQLTDEHERVDLQLREKEEEVRKIRQGREETGVQLYGVQHQLAKMQTTFERTHDNYNIVQRYRIEAERQHEILQRQYEAKKEEADEQLKRVLKAQEELNQLNRTLKQVEEYNEVMKSEIALTRRTTYRAEENVGNLEKTKKKQDLLINNMNEEIKRLNEQKTLYQAQLISQKEETAAARNTLKEAAIEIERIVMSKKTLLEDWQGALFGMEERDKALQAIRELTNQKKDEVMQIESEISGVHNDTKKEHDLAERLHERLTKAKRELEFLQTRKQDIEADKNRLQEQFTMLKASLNQTESESARMDSEKGAVEEKQTILEKSIMQLHSKTKDIRDDIVNHASQQKTIEKSSANLLKQTKMAYQNISKKEVEIEDIANEISRVKIDNLNTQNQNGYLQEKLQQLIVELKKKEQEVSAEERDIKKTHLMIEQRQLQVDRLNRQYAELTKDGQEDDKDKENGPLENELASIRKQIIEQADLIQGANKNWIDNQRELIDQQEAHEKTSREIEEMLTRKSVLEQKRLRLSSNVSSQNKEIRELQVALKNLDFEMNKLNDLYYKNKSSKEVLTNANFNIENEFQQKLKELENETIKLEDQITKLKESKAEILAEIVEAERQILLWKRKTQLEQEMQEALDPDIGQTEIVAMRKEIHRMKLRYDQLRKKQEELIKDMERSVFKRETIQLKYLPKVEKKNAEDRSSQGKLSRQIANLKQTLKHTTENAMQMDTTMEQRKREVSNVQGDIETERDQNQQNQGEMRRHQWALVARKLDKCREQYTNDKLNTMSGKFSEVATNQFQSQVPEDQAAQVLEQEARRNAVIEAVINSMRGDHEMLDQILRPLCEW